MNSDPQPLDGFRILVAEDEPLLLIDIHYTLTNAGAKIVGPAASIQSAMFLAQSETIDCAVLNVKLIGGDIDPVADLLYQGGKGLVFVTAVIDTGRLLQNWPLAEIVSKPALEQDLIRAAVAACGDCPKHAPAATGVA